MVVDAWVALQALRAAAAAPPDKAPDQADVDRLYKTDIDRIALEHLLVGSAIVVASGLFLLWHEAQRRRSAQLASSLNATAREAKMQVRFR